jgi:hypothetical protein
MTVCLRIRCIFLICSTESQCENAATGVTGVLGPAEVVVLERLVLGCRILLPPFLTAGLVEFGYMGTSIRQEGSRGSHGRH